MMTEPCVFIAMSMPQDEEKPVLTRRVGVTREAAKEAVIEVTEELTGLHLHDFEWGDQIAHRGDWKFVVKQKELHGGDMAEPIPDNDESHCDTQKEGQTKTDRGELNAPANTQEPMDFSCCVRNTKYTWDTCRQNTHQTQTQNKTKPRLIPLTDRQERRTRLHTCEHLTISQATRLPFGHSNRLLASQNKHRLVTMGLFDKQILRRLTRTRTSS